MAYNYGIDGRPKSRPAKKGIKTRLLDVRLDIPGPKSRPAKKGIKTSVRLITVHRHLCPKSRPAKKGIKTMAMRRFKQIIGSEKQTRQKGD